MIRNPTDGYCDDGNTNNGDGCSADCKPETDYVCRDGDRYNPSKCYAMPKLSIF